MLPLLASLLACSTPAEPPPAPPAPADPAAPEPEGKGGKKAKRGGEGKAPRPAAEISLDDPITDLDLPVGKGKVERKEAYTLVALYEGGDPAALRQRYDEAIEAAGWVEQGSPSDMGDGTTVARTTTTRGKRRTPRRTRPTRG